MMYALGREVEYHDMPQIRSVVRAASQHDYRMSAIVAGIVKSDAFRMQALPHERNSENAQAGLRDVVAAAGGSVN